MVVLILYYNYVHTALILLSIIIHGFIVSHLFFFLLRIFFIIINNFFLNFVMVYRYSVCCITIYFFFN